MNTAAVQVDLFSEPTQFEEPLATFRSADAAKHHPILSPVQADKQLVDWIAYAEGQCRGSNADITVLSLFDESGVWSAPYVRAGYNVIQLDIQNGVDILELGPEEFHSAYIDNVDIILSANPCTVFANSGARWFAEKDKSGVTQGGIDLVEKTKSFIEYFQPIVWAIENPIGRIKDLCGLPSPRLRFHPHHYGDPYTKYTQLFGEFNHELPVCNVEPTLGSHVHRLRGDVPAQKKARSITPEGFSYAFFMANQLHLLSALELNKRRYPEWDD